MNLKKVMKKNMNIMMRMKRTLRMSMNMKKIIMKRVFTIITMNGSIIQFLIKKKTLKRFKNSKKILIN